MCLGFVWLIIISTVKNNDVYELFCNHNNDIYSAVDQSKSMKQFSFQLEHPASLTSPLDCFLLLQDDESDSCSITSNIQ